MYAQRDNVSDDESEDGHAEDEREPGDPVRDGVGLKMTRASEELDKGKDGTQVDGNRCTCDETRHSETVADLIIERSLGKGKRRRIVGRSSRWKRKHWRRRYIRTLLMRGPAVPRAGDAT
jgi:hypothetical protein